jgi:hypothetical protein
MIRLYLKKTSVVVHSTISIVEAMINTGLQPFLQRKKQIYSLTYFVIVVKAVTQFCT